MCVGSVTVRVWRMMTDTIRCDLCCSYVGACKQTAQLFTSQKYTQLLIEERACIYCILLFLRNIRSITNDWMKHQAGLSQADSSVNTLQHDLGQLASAHSEIEKAVTEILQLQETKLADQIQNTSDG